MKLNENSEHRSATRKVYTGGTPTNCLLCGETDPSAFRKNERRKRCKACWAKVKRKDPDWQEKQQEKDKRPENRFSQSRSKAKKRGDPWTLPLEEYAALLLLDCFYCGGELPETGRGVDRRDNSQGYHSGNCVACCAPCNQMKNGNVLEMEMVEMGALMRKFRERRAQLGLPKLDAWQACRRKGIL